MSPLTTCQRSAPHAVLAPSSQPYGPQAAAMLVHGISLSELELWSCGALADVYPAAPGLQASSFSGTSYASQGLPKYHVEEEHLGPR